MPRNPINNIKQNNKVVKEREREAERSLSRRRRRFLKLRKRVLFTSPLESVPLMPLKKNRYGGFIHAVLVMSSDDKVKDFTFIRTNETLQKIYYTESVKGNKILLHPLPIRVNEGFWAEWKKARTRASRLDLAKKYEILKDNHIYIFDKIVIDIDKPYEEVEPKLLEVFKELGIEKGYELGKTKSGNLRAVIYLQPLRIQKEIGAKKLEIEIYQGSKHTDKYRELLYILYEMTSRKGIAIDRTFIDRLNHPIWFSYDGRFYERKVKIEGENKLYSIYNRAKAWQKKNKAYIVLGQNLTKKFYPHLTKDWKDPNPRRTRIELPAFIRNKINTELSDAFGYWSKAVDTLSRNTKSQIYTRLIQVAVGWAKYLNLDRYDVDRYLLSILSYRDSKKTEKDIRTAWNRARELEFKLPEKVRVYDFSKLVEEALNYINEQGTAKRQELLEKVFYKQVWLLEKVIGWLEAKGYIQAEYQKQGRGRPIKVYSLLKDFSQYNNSLSMRESILVVDGIADGR